MKIIAIVAASENNVIGIANDMPWRLPDDFKFFKNTTMHFPVLLGSKTWRSLGEKPLPGRKHLVISRKLNIDEEAVKTFSEIETAIDFARAMQSEKLFIIGGGNIYKQTLLLCDEVLLTRVHTHVSDGEVFFPKLDETVWQLSKSDFHPADERHPFAFTFEHWIRR